MHKFIPLPKQPNSPSPIQTPRDKAKFNHPNSIPESTNPFTTSRTRLAQSQAAIAERREMKSQADAAERLRRQRLAKETGMDENDPTLSLPFQNTLLRESCVMPVHAPQPNVDNKTRGHEKPQHYTKDQQQEIMTKLLMQHLRARTHYTQASVQVARRINGIVDVDERTIVPLEKPPKNFQPTSQTVTTQLNICRSPSTEFIPGNAPTHTARLSKRRKQRISKKRAEYEEVQARLEERKRQKRIQVQQQRLDRTVALGIREWQLPQEDVDSDDAQTSEPEVSAAALRDLMRRQDEEDAFSSSVSDDGDEYTSSGSDSREDPSAQSPYYAALSILPSTKPVKADVEAKREEIREIRRAIKRHQRGLGTDDPVRGSNNCPTDSTHGGETANEALAALKASRALVEDGERRKRLELAAHEYGAENDVDRGLGGDEGVDIYLPSLSNRAVVREYRPPEEVLRTQYDAQLQRLFSDPSKRGAGEDLSLPPTFDGLSVSAITESICTDANEIVLATEGIMRTVNDSSRRQRRTASVDSDLDRANRAILKGVLWMTEGSHQLERLLRGLANIQDCASSEVIERRRGISSKHDELDQFGRQLDRQREEMSQLQKIKDELARELQLKRMLLGQIVTDEVATGRRSSFKTESRGSAASAGYSKPPTPTSKPPTPSLIQNPEPLRGAVASKEQSAQAVLQSPRLSLQAFLRLRQLLGKWTVMAGPSKGPNTTSLSGAQQQAALSPLAALFAKNKALSAAKAGGQQAPPAKIPQKPAAPLRPIEVALEALSKELLTRTTMADLRLECQTDNRRPSNEREM